MASSVRHSVGSFSDVWKQVILSRVLKHMTYEIPSALTFYDFTPSQPRLRLRNTNQHYQQGLDLLHKHGQQEFEAKKLNYFQFYTGYLKKFNNIGGFNYPLEQSSDLSYFPSAAGLTRMFMRPFDRMHLITESSTDDGYVKGKLEEEFKDDRRVRIFNDLPSVELAAAQLPPLTRHGLVHFDLDAAWEAENTNTTNTMEKDYKNFLSVQSNIITEACRRWPRATYVISYNIMGGQPLPPVDFLRNIVKTGQNYVLNAYMMVESEGMGIGTVIVNPPHSLDVSFETHLPALKEQVLTMGKLGQYEKISPVVVQWLTPNPNRNKQKHMLVSDARMTWMFSKTLNGHPLREAAGPMEDGQWDYHLNFDPEQANDEWADIHDGVKPTPKIKLETKEDKRIFEDMISAYWNRKSDV